MKRTQNLLMAVFWGQLLLAALIYVCCEYLHIDIAVLADTAEQTRYVVSTVMILATLTFVPTALRMFKMRRIHAELVNFREAALLKWGVVRLTLLGDAMIINTMLYYLFGFEPSFGYLAVILLLAMPFVYPTMDRCMAEVEEEAPLTSETPEAPMTSETPESPAQ